MNDLGILRLPALLVALVLAAPGHASDHADPMSLNLFALQAEPEANLTDLHAFVVDSAGRPLPPPRAEEDAQESIDPFGRGARLVVALSLRANLDPRRRQPLDLTPYTFRMHLDLSPPVRRVRGGESGRLRHLQALYGGIVTHPEDIAEAAILEFRLESSDGEVRLARWSASGLSGGGKSVAWEKGTPPGPRDVVATAGVFDDPFVFPRFFRRNVVAIVASIPLARLLPSPPDREAPILLWATTHRDGRQIDHVGRAVRTQLPRFGLLNEVHPSRHVETLAQAHESPSITGDVLGTAVTPLFARRHFDFVPDVMIFDLRRPAGFPNGRRLEDDVVGILAAAGEALLVELSYAESREYPRATENDKSFRSEFPYLAEPWTQTQIAAAEGLAGVPHAPDADAIAPLDLDDSTFRTLFWGAALAVVLLAAALVVALRSWGWRWLVVISSVLVLFVVWPVYAGSLGAAEPEPPGEPLRKLLRLGAGLGWSLVLAFGFAYALGGRWARRPRPRNHPFPRGRQGKIADDDHRASYEEIRRALFDPVESRPYGRPWGPRGCPLPRYPTTFRSIVEGLLASEDGTFAMLRAARRTLLTRGDLRFGPDRRGFRRLVHPMGVCLEGTWEIDPASPAPDYTGYFAPGMRGRVIARYSLGGNAPEGGRFRSLGLAGKVFPEADAAEGVTPRAHFITQEDLGGARTSSISEAILTNSPPVTLRNRGRGLFAFLPVILALRIADVEPAERQLYEIAELEKDPQLPTSCPRFLRLRVVGPPVDRGGEGVDFRNEIMGRIYAPGAARPSGDLLFSIEVSDEGRRTLFQRVVGQEWTRIGTLTFHEAAASYNGDFVVHFHHPPWRRDRNDPRSVHRRRLSKGGEEVLA